MELDIMWKSRIENKVLLRQMGVGLVDTKRVLINNGKIKSRSQDRRVNKKRINQYGGRGSSDDRFGA